jgi:hypothetical protein
MKFSEELIACFTLIRHGPQRKQRVLQIPIVTGTHLPSRCLAATGKIYIVTGKVG